MRKAILLFGLVYGTLACGSQEGRKGADRFDLSNPRTVPEIGKVLYLRYCASCHPALKCDNMLAASVRSAEGDFSVLQIFVRSQDSLLKAGDPYALELNQKWGNQPYRHSFNLSDAELKALFYYMEATF